MTTPAMLGLEIDYGRAPKRKAFTPTRMAVWLERDGVRRQVTWRSDAKRASRHSDDYAYGAYASIARKPGERIVKIKVLEWRLKDGL